MICQGDVRETLQAHRQGHPDTVLVSPAESPAKSRSSNDQKALLPGLLAILAGLLAAALLLWFGLSGNNQQEQLKLGKHGAAARPAP